jgi:hypothetical protein
MGGEEIPVKLFSPMAEGETPRRALAPRPRSLDGKVLGVLDNGKWNAGKLLSLVVEALGKEQRFTEVIRVRKPAFSAPAPGELLDDLGRRCDVAVTAIGD